MIRCRASADGVGRTDPEIFFLLFLPAIERVQRNVVRPPEESEIYIQAAAHVLGQYRHRLDGAPSPREPEQLRNAAQIERKLRLTALQAERDKIFSLARQSRISDQTARKLVREIDLVESRYR